MVRSGDTLAEPALVQFNLEVPELPEAQQELDQLKRDLSRPVVLEVRIKAAEHGLLVVRLDV